MSRISPTSSANTRFHLLSGNETKKANAPPALFFVFAARARRFPFFPSPHRGRWSAGRRQGFARPLTGLARARSARRTRQACEACPGTRAPFGERGCASRRSTSRSRTPCPVLAPKGLGPDLRPHPPARSARQTPHESGGQRNVVGDRNIICRKKVKVAKGTVESNASHI